FNIIKTKDEKSFVSLFPNSVQFSKLMRTMMESMFKSEQMKEMMAADEKSKNMNIDSLINLQIAVFSDPKTIEKMEQSYAKLFQETIKNAESKGINWIDAKLTSYTIDTASVDEGVESEMIKASGIKNMKGIIDFTSGGKEYQMQFGKVMWIPSENGWFGVDIGPIARKGELGKNVDILTPVDEKEKKPEVKKNSPASATKKSATNTKKATQKKKTKS
ncbi:MAG TPA: hypothetical protein VM368_04445, partial [Flavisolibacter sp.]|nr:hypothetical protein [Flavisolibacter sp.]